MSVDCLWIGGNLVEICLGYVCGCGCVFRVLVCGDVKRSLWVI